MGDNKNSKLILVTDEFFPRLEIIFGNNDSFRDPLIIDAEEFIAVKGYKAKGKRITTFNIDTINELDPIRFPQQEEAIEENQTTEVDITETEVNMDPDQDKSESDILDEITGQMKLF